MGYNAAGEGDLDRVFITNAELVDQYIGEKLYAFGANNYGQLGDNTNSSRLSPVEISGGGSNWVSVSNGYYHSAAIKTDGTLWVNGFGSFAQLGDGTTTSRSSPVTTAGGGTNWKQVACGYRNTTSIKTDGTLWTWGDNAYGQLGTGNTSTYSSPVTTSGGGNNWKQVACGYRHMSAVKTDGTLWTWGSNSNGQLGDWTAGTSRTSPAVVVGPPALKDASVNRKDITFPSLTSPVKSNFKKFDNETMYFDGSGYLTVPCTTNSTPYGTENWTIEFWMYATSAGSYGIMELPGSVSLGMVNGVAPMVMWNGIQANGMGYYNNVFQNRWVHLAAVKNGTTFTFYVNGQTNGTSTIASTNFPTSDITIGYASQMGNFYGYLDQVRIIKGVAKYTAAFTPSLYPMFDPISADPYYSNVSLLLKADDVVNAANNNTFVDNSGNNLAITRNGNTTQGSFSPFAVESGKWSNYFDGTGDSLYGSGSSLFNFGTDNFTIESWIYLTNNAQSDYFGNKNAAIFSIANDTYNSFLTFNVLGNTTNTGIGLSIDKNQNTTEKDINQNFYEIRSASAPISKNSWHHIAVSKSGTEIKFFLNGFQIGTTQTSTTIWGDSSTTFRIGRMWHDINFQQWFPGYISNLRVIKGTALYTANFTPSTVPLTAVAGTSLLTCQDNRFVDNSINNFALTPVGDVKPAPTSPFSKSTDILAPYFSTANTDYLSVSNNNVFNMGSSDFTVECWFYPTSIPANADNASHLITLSQDPISGASSWSFGLGYGGTAANNLTSFGFAYVGGSGSTCSGTAKLSLNTWTHVAMVRSGSTVYLYQNGVQVASAAISGSLNFDSSYTVKIGRASSNPTRYFYGYLSDLRVVNGTAVYTSNFTPSTQPLKAIANTVLLTCQSDTVDNSSNRFTVTKNGNVNVMPVVPYESPTGNSLYVGGSGYSQAARVYTSGSTLNAGTGDFTIECYFYMEDAVRLFDLFNGSTANGFTVVVSGGSVQLYTNNQDFTSGNISISPYAWHHFALTRVGGTVRFFIDGVYYNHSYAGMISGTNLNTSGLLSIGIGQGWNAYYGKGYISNFRYIVGTGIYTTSFTPSKFPLTAIANTALLTCQDKVLKDNGPNNLTVTNTDTICVVKQFGPFKPSDYYFGGSIYLDGTGDYLQSASSSTFTVGTGDFTMECWVYSSSVDQSGKPFMSLSSLSGSTNSLTVTFNSGYVWVYLNNGTLFLAGSPKANAWNHVALSRQSGTLTTYLNGVQIDSRSETTNYDTTAGSIGTTDRWFNGASFLGYVSDFRVIKGTALYTAAFTPPTKPALPVANTSLLLSGTNAGIVDSTGRNNLETAGNAQISTNYRKWNTGSMYFDGAGGSALKIDNPGLYMPGDFTLEFWFNTSINTASELFNYNFANANGLYIRVGTSDDVYVSGTNIGSITPYIKINTWQHIAVCRESGSVSVYIDGIKRLSGSNSSSIGSSNPIYLGTGGQGWYHLWYLDDLRITNGVSRYTKNFSVTSKQLSVVTNPVATTSLLTCQSSTIVDNSTNALTITTTGSVPTSTFAPFLGTNSNQFTFSASNTNYLSINNTTKLNLPTATTPFTIEAWTYRTSAGGTILSEQYSSTVALTFHFGTGSFNTTSGNYLTVAAYSGSWSTGVVSTEQVPLNTWNHVAVSYDGTTTKLFVNGRDVTGTGAPSSWPVYGASTSRSWYIGHRWDGSQADPYNNYSGYISNLRFVIGQALYTSNFTLSDVPNPPVRSLPARYVAPDANYSSVGMQMNPNEIVNLDYSGGWKQVATGYLHTAAIKSDGSLWAWGQNQYGRLGDGTTVTKSYPVSLPYSGSWKQVVAGSEHSAAIKSDGTLWTWGYNGVGQLGDGTTSNRSSPVTTVAGGRNWKQLASGSSSTHAVKTDGTLWGWGYDGYGKLGDLSTTNKSSPVQVVSGNISNWKTVASGGAWHTTAIAQD